MSGVRRVSFVVRVVQDRKGRLNGVIERVATGAKEAFDGTEVIGPIILKMLMRDPRGPSAGAPGCEPGAGDRPPRGSTRCAATD
jgi:hypothetical protein